ncbi:SAM-dependent methyltransferase [Neptunitalea chrysea]|uniref:SAM-dependent methyltransferase n=1 Tax=Neptunitalea chrysea TaxID=1647581 RepID=A0A9W6B485_9FLAO|nr:methyltransferase [Neptunitalea chrysea]GLB52241.1 SAM-dependent methyltransferase [Neptunitalea chrysea]
MNKEYWSDRYIRHNTKWDVGYAIPALTDYIDQLENKELKILIPGCGHAYEASYLFSKGFTNVYIADITEEPLNNFRERVPEFPKSHILITDFFSINDTFDLIFEHTFFCALDIKMRTSYIKKMHELLNLNGKLTGVLFSFPLTENGPPFGGDINEYKKLFLKHFQLIKIENCKNSIKPRMSNELFFIAKPI